MTTAAKKVLEAALELPADERERIVVELAASFKGGFAGKALEEAWLTEIDRRWSEVESGQAVLHDWGTVREILLSDLSDRH
jgi:putative addiction module component (TIGR02574 family)